MRSSERGAVVIQVAVFLLGLMAFSALVIDYGIMWTSRGQAQTAADAGALSGALSLAFESPDRPNAQLTARTAARANWVWGQAPDVQLTDVTFLTPATCKPPLYPGLPDTCVKVDVYRNQARVNPLPMFFGNLVGVGSQGVRATATAQIFSGASTDCLKPWAVVDRWNEYGPEGFLPTSTYDKYSDGKGKNPPPEPDVYIPPGVDSSNPDGTGWRLPDDQGRQYAIKTEGTDISSGWFREILLPRADGHWTGGNVYNENIETCGGLTYSIAQPGIACPASIGQSDAAYWASKGCYGVKTGGTVGPTRAGIEYLIAKDDQAKWYPPNATTTGEIIESKFDPPTSSPRVVPIGAMDIDDYLARNPTGSTGTVRLVNIYGYFIEGMGDIDKNTGKMTLNPAGKAVIGRIIKIPTTGISTSPIPATASFLNQVILVR